MPEQRDLDFTLARCETAAPVLQADNWLMGGGRGLLTNRRSYWLLMEQLRIQPTLDASLIDCIQNRIREKGGGFLCNVIKRARSVTS